MRRIAQQLLLPVLALVAFAAAAGAQTSSTPAGDQDGFWARWFKRSDHSKAEQPHWMTPVAPYLLRP